MDLDELERIYDRLCIERGNVEDALNGLTTNGSGALHDLKIICGEDTEVGETMSEVGANICNIADEAISALNEVLETMNSNLNSLGRTVNEYNQALQSMPHIEYVSDYK